MSADLSDHWRRVLRLLKIFKCFSWLNYTQSRTQRSACSLIEKAKYLPAYAYYGTIVHEHTYSAFLPLRVDRELSHHALARKIGHVEDLRAG